MRISDWSSDVCSSDLARRREYSFRRGFLMAAKSTRSVFRCAPQHTGSILSSCGQMERRRECRKPEHILARLAISPNPGDKLWLGEGIRASGSRRLIEGLKRSDEHTTELQSLMR